MNRPRPVAGCCRIWSGRHVPSSSLGHGFRRRARALVSGFAGNASQAQSARTLDALYRSEGSKLRRFFRSRLRSSEEANDLVQEAFTRFAGVASTVMPERPAAYLQRIATNLLIDRARRPPLWTELIEAEIAVRPEQEDAIAATDTLAIYRRALDEMPDRTRTVFLLHRVNELPYREIGTRLGISIPAVQKHVARALERIATALYVEDR